MCLILFSWQPNDEYQLIVAANRDEFYQRPSDKARFWPDNPDVLAGRDLQAGGTWLGLTRTGRFAAVTNFAEDPPDPLPPLSRGNLTGQFLTSNQHALSYLHEIDQRAMQYRGFNLLLGHSDALYYYSNHQQQIKSLDPGCYGLSNQYLDCTWPKVVDGRDQLTAMTKAGFTTERLFQLLLDKGREDEPWSAKFIQSPDYGTRAATVLTVKTNGDVFFAERLFSATGNVCPGAEFTFHISS